MACVSYIRLSRLIGRSLIDSIFRCSLLVCVCVAVDLTDGRVEAFVKGVVIHVIDEGLSVTTRLVCARVRVDCAIYRQKSTVGNAINVNRRLMKLSSRLFVRQFAIGLSFVLSRQPI